MPNIRSAILVKFGFIRSDRRNFPRGKFMSSLAKRLAVFRQLPLRAQLATIVSTKANQVLSQNTEYVASLEQIHTETLAAATEAERLAYNKAKDLLGS